MEPDWAWSLDATPEGTNDFRSTKRNISTFSLNSKQGTGLSILAKGNQHARAYVDKDWIRLQVADYSNMGDQIFRWWDEGKNLVKGDILSGKVKIAMKTQLHK
jgi:beta-galactosidase